LLVFISGFRFELMTRAENDKDDEMISAVFTPLEIEPLSNDLGVELEKSSTTEKSSNMKTDTAVTWTNLSDVCSEILQTADDETKSPPERASNSTTIIKPVVGGGSIVEKVSSLVKETTLLIEEVKSVDSNVSKTLSMQHSSSVEKLHVRNKASDNRCKKK